MKLFLIFIFINAGIAACFSQGFYDTSYFDNGKIRHYGFHDKQKELYLDYHFYYNGNLQFVHQYDSSNFLAGDSLRAYNINGTFALQMVYKNGLPNGAFKEYFPNGAIKREGQYSEGFKSGNWRQFYANGKLASEYSFILSKEDSALTKALTIANFDPSIMGYELFEFGEVDSTLGNSLQFINLMKYKYSYFLSTPHGIWKNYDAEGNLISSINYNKKRRKTTLQRQ